MTVPPSTSTSTTSTSSSEVPQGPLGFSGVANGTTGTLIQLGSTADILLGFGMPPPEGSAAGGVAAVGSVTVGMRGYTPVGHVTVYGAVGYLKQDEGALTLDHGVILTGVARYVFEGSRTRPFIDLGVWSTPHLGLTLTRSYTSGGTPATGVGHPGGDAAALFLRSGVLLSGAPGHSVELAAGLERYRVTVDSYTEAASASNPFPASFGPTSIYGTQAKLSVSVTRPLGKRGDASLALGVGRAWFSGNVAGSVSGVSFSGNAQDTTFAQLMLRAGWLVGKRSRLDTFVTSTAGNHLKTHSSAGVAWTFLF